MKRYTFLSLVFSTLLICVTVRVFIVSVVNSDKYSKAAVAQQMRETTVRTSRKIIYDRNMIPLTESTSDLYCVIFCEECPQRDRISTLTGEQIPEKGVKIIRMPTDVELQSEIMSLRGVTPLTMPTRYSADNLFCHLIGYGGYTNGSGLEKALDNSLTTDRQQKIYTLSSANDAPLYTQGYYSHAENNLSGVVITADRHIQKICEDVMDKMCPEGAVIVTDVETGDILAMASRPAYSQDNPSKYFNGGGSQLLNRAISAYDMGSVFKVLITGVALDKGIVAPTDTFTCTGSLDIDGMTFYCNNTSGHGQLTFEDAFAQSCNIPFYQLGQQLGWEIIYEYACKVGFGNNIIDLALDEAKGVLPRRADSPRALANLSIGQGNMNGTPLQVAQLVQTFANGGQKTPLCIIDGKVGPDGKTFSESARLPDQRIFSTRTALILRRLMTYAVLHGTGTPAKSETVSIAGKTGSAETGWQENGETMTHGWFAGFFPADNPRYVCVVLCENGKQGGGSCGPIFKEIAEQISLLY